MFLGRGGAQRRHGIGDARLMQAHHVHVAFDDHQAFEVGARLAGLVQTVELAALVEQRRLGRVQVLGLALIDDATAEAEDPAARIAYREHQAVSKSIIESALAPRRRRADRAR